MISPGRRRHYSRLHFHSTPALLQRRRGPRFGLNNGGEAVRVNRALTLLVCAYIHLVLEMKKQGTATDSKRRISSISLYPQYHLVWAYEPEAERGRHDFYATVMTTGQVARMTQALRGLCLGDNRVLHGVSTMVAGYPIPTCSMSRRAICITLVRPKRWGQ